MFGGGGGRESRPQYVQNEWSLATEFIKDYIGAVRSNKINNMHMRFVWDRALWVLGHQAGFIGLGSV